MRSSGWFLYFLQTTPNIYSVRKFPRLNSLGVVLKPISGIIITFGTVPSTPQLLQNTVVVILYKSFCCFILIFYFKTVLFFLLFLYTLFPLSDLLLLFSIYQVWYISFPLNIPTFRLTIRCSHTVKVRHFGLFRLV